MSVKLIKAALYSYVALAIAYALYSTFTGTGLAGWFMDWQMQTLGAAYLKLTALVTTLVLCAPVLAMQKIAERALGVHIPLTAHQRQRAALEAGGAAQGADLKQSSFQRTFVGVLIVSLIPTLIAVPVYFYLAHASARDEQSEIREINLNRDSAASFAGARFVRLTGALQENYSYGIEEGSRSSSRRQYSYTPLTGVRWSLPEPVHVFVASDSPAGATRLSRPPRMTRDRNSNESDAAGDVIEGRLHEGDMPVYARNEFERQGVRIASPYYVLDRMSFIDGRVPNIAQQQQYHLIPILGLGLSAVILIGGGGGLLIRKFILRRDA